MLLFNAPLAMPGTLSGLSLWRLLTTGILGLLVSACSTHSAKTGAGIDSAASLSQRAETGTGAPADFIAESAWLAGNRFYIRYRTGSEVAYTTGTWGKTALSAGNGAERLAPARTAGVPTEVALQAVQEAAASTCSKYPT